MQKYMKFQLSTPKLSKRNYIRLSEKFLSFHKVTMDDEEFLFYIILLN